MMKALKLLGGAVSLYSPNIHLSDYSNQSIGVDLNNMSGKVIHNKNVILAKYDDVHFFNGPVFLCEILFLIQCDKNFAFHWLTDRSFPNLREVYLASHPCEPVVLIRNQSIDVYLHDTYIGYKEAWWPDRENIKLISGESFETALRQYDDESEEMIMFEN
jgi:hypothetical protein